MDLLIEEYRKNSNKKAIIIYGGPGSGKSSYIARLIHYNPYVLASIFCEWDKPIFSETKNIIKTLAFKIASKLQDYREILVNKLAAINESDLNKMDANSLFNYLLTEPLNLLIDGNRETMFIIIDGLDESEELSLVKTLANNLLNLPRWIILLFTSREDYDIKNILENYCLNSINISSNENSHCDIERYLVKELGNLSLNIKKLVEICDGNFLYASLLVKEIKTGFIDIESISTDINSFYALNFRRKFSSLEIYRNYKDILQTILCGNNLPMEILEQIYTYDKVIDFLKIFSSFLVISKHLVIDTTKEYQRISLCHKSLKDFLTNKEKSKEFYLDEKSGYLAIASYFKNLVLNSKLIYEEEDNFLLYYMQNNIVDFYIQSKAYLELEEFLLEPTISLERYFEKIDRAFPEDFDFRKISKRLWEAPDLISFVCEKQKLGNTKLLSYIFKILIAYYDLSNFSYELIKIYIDIVHLSGRYEEAVQISEAYLSQFENKQIYNDKNLLMMKIRTIHHKMFYLPVGELIIEAQAIERNLDCNKYPIEYNELLFLIGGNLGLLFGNQELNEHYLNLSLHWARNNNLENYEIRTIRKIVDMLAINNQHQEALDLLGNYLDFNNLANVKTRYHIYLIGALGEIYRNLGQNAKAMECFEIVKEASENRGIKGWVAHAYLGLAFIMFNQNKEKAKKLAKHALKIYEEIKQVFGMINAKMIILLSEDQDLRSLEAKVEKYNYQYIKKEISNFNHEKYHISFL